MPSTTHRLIASALLVGTIALASCSSSVNNPPDVGPTNTSSGNGNPGGATAVTPPAGTRALFQPAQGILPFPTDLYFSGSTDGTLNLPANALTPNATALNTLDGFSTVAPIRARFSGAINPASLTAANVRVIQVTIDNTTKATTGIVRSLVLGTDFAVAAGTEAGVGNTVVEIRPFGPLVPSTGTTNNGYLALLTNGISDAAGAAVVPDADYAAIKAALPTCASITNATLNGVCRLVGANLQIAGAPGLGVNPANVVLSFSFSTQSIRDTLAAVAAQTLAQPAQPIGAQATGLTTAQANPALAGKANLHVGTLRVPYYLSRTAPLTGFWQGNASPLDATSRFLTRFNPLPVATENLSIPLLVTVPNATSLSLGVKPPTGWPVAIFQHGITGNRSQMLALADAFADAGFVVVAIDQPLHGITDTTSALYARNPAPATGSIERTFDLDLINNQTGATGPDGVIDPSGTHFINLPSLLTSRDNLRQTVADLLVLTRALPSLNLDADPAGDVNPDRIHFVGHSLGGIAGGVYSSVATSVRTTTLAMPGGGIAELLRSSPTFGPRIVAGLQAQGLAPGTTLFEQFFRDAQTVIDPADPLNYIASAAAAHPTHLIQVVGNGTTVPPDQVVPNSATARLIAAGGLTRVPPINNPNPAGHRVYVNFTAGDHGSILSPTASAAATVEMQTQTVSFAASDGTILPVSGNPAIVQQ